MGGTTHAAATAAAVKPSNTPIPAPRVLDIHPTGVLYHKKNSASGGQVGKERGLRRTSCRAPPGLFTGLRSLAGAGRRLGRRALALRPRPALLVGDLVSLLDQQEVDQARQRVGEELEVPVPVSRRVCQRLH